MSQAVITSSWPLPENGVRLVIAPKLRRQLERHPLGAGCYPQALGFYPQAAGHRMRRTRHEDHLLIYCRAGQGWLKVGEQHYEVRGGDLLLLPAGVAHEYGADSQRPWTLYWVHFAGTHSGAFIELLGNRPWRRIGVLPRLLAEFEALLALQKQGLSLPHYLHAAHQLQSLLSFVAVLPAQLTLKSGRRLDVEAVHSYMRQHLPDQLNLEQLAAQFKLSRFHFARVYRELTGHSPMQDFIQLKMAQACRLLDEGELNVRQVAEQLGYDDSYYFSRLFKQVVGIAPSHYRALHQG